MCRNEQTEALLSAVEQGDIGRLRRMLDDGVDIDARERTGWTAVLKAAACAQAEAFDVLAAAGADLTARDAEGNTALHFAAQTDQVEIAQLLLEGGLDVDTRNTLRGTPLMWAARSGSVNVMELLLDAGANVNAGNKQGLSALRVAHGRHAKKLLEQAGAAKQPEESLEPTPTERFLEAAEAGDDRTLRQMLDDGLPVDTHIGWGNTALARAVARGHIAAVELLLQAGADPHVRDQDGGTLLLSAAFVENAALLQRLIAAGIDVNEPDENGFTPLMAACYHGDLDSVKLLVNAGGDLTARGSFALYEDKTPLEFASQERKRRVVKYLQQVGTPADPAQDGFDEVERFVEASQHPSFQEVLQELRTLGGHTPKEWQQSAGVFQIDFAAQAYPRLAERFGDQADQADCLESDEAQDRCVRLLRRLQLDIRSVGYLLVQSRPETAATVLLFPTSRPATVVAACRTEGPNHGVTTADIIDWLRKLVDRQAFLLTACSGDLVGGQFLEPVSHTCALELAEQMVEFCPSVLDGDLLASASSLAGVLETTKEFFLWWD